MVDVKLPALWRTRDGETLPIVEMADDHLKNAIGMIERRVASLEGAGLSAARSKISLLALTKERDKRARLAKANAARAARELAKVPAVPPPGRRKIRLD